MALNEFEGTVLLVSHDRALLREVCDEFWLVTGGAVKPFDGDLDDYQKWLLEQSREAAKAQAKGAKAARADKNENRDKPAKGKPKFIDKNAVAGAASPGATPAPSVTPVPSAAVRQQRAEETKPLRKELNRIDNRLGVLMTDRDACEGVLGSGTTTPAQLAEHGKQLKLINAEIDTLEARWLELSTQVDALSA